ncbi:MAG: Vi polysaccharide biosynthesis UDP-N-acetylglucosamine C-6 dehydrogenase TviB, partial [Flavobacterium sp.]
GGHCIGVDPYYLAHKSEALGYKPEVILSGRRVNDNMGKFVAQKVVKLMVEKGKAIKNAKVLVLGFAFKENCPDTRNTKVIDIYKELKEFTIDVDVYDPWANKEKVQNEYGLTLINHTSLNTYEAIILAVAHQEFAKIDFSSYKQNGAIIFDTKSFINRDFVDARL